MTNYEVFEGNGTSKSKLASNPDIVVGDTIEFSSNNPRGYTKHEVILNEKGEKALKLIDDFDMQEERLTSYENVDEHSDSDSDNENGIGNKRKRSNSYSSETPSPLKRNMREQSYSPSATNYKVFEGEGESPESELATNPDIMVGDTIEYEPNNQTAYIKYEVILDEKGDKDLKIIDTYQMKEDRKMAQNEEIDGGKRKTTKRKTGKRKGGK